MKLVRFGSAGAERPGLVLADGSIADLSGVVPDLAGAALSPESLKKLAALDAAKLPKAPAGARLGACVAGVGKFIAIGLNYADHAAETGAKIPAEPIVFMKATSCIVGPNDTVHHAARLHQDRLGSRARRGHRQRRPLRRARATRSKQSRAIA